MDEDKIERVLADHRRMRILVHRASQVTARVYQGFCALNKEERLEYLRRRIAWDHSREGLEARKA